MLVLYYARAFNYFFMVHDKIQMTIQKVRKLDDALKEAKKDVKKEEKIEDEKYQELKTGLKEMRTQVKDFEEDYLADMKKSEFYTKLREQVLKAEEELALEKEKLFALLEKVPLKAFEIDAKDDEDAMVKIQALPEMRIYVNGKEVKK